MDDEIFILKNVPILLTQVPTLQAFVQYLQAHCLKKFVLPYLTVSKHYSNLAVNYQNKLNYN